MKRFSQLFLYVTVALLLLWQLPWCYAFFAAKSAQMPFTLYSGQLGDFILVEHEEGTGIVRHDAAGRVFTEEQVDSLLPFFYVRQLMADERFPDTVQGVAVTAREAQLTNFSFRCSPKDINTVAVPLYSLLESKSKRVDLEMPADVFRFTESGIQFIDMESNSVDEEKSLRYTEALQKKGFVFPAYRVAGNPTTRKDYDEGYLLLDSERKLFHLKQVVGRPYVRAVELPEGLQPDYLFITEFRGRQTLGFLVDTAHKLYVITPKYDIVCTGVPAYDPQRESLTIYGNMLDWTVSIRSEEQAGWYALDAHDYSLLKRIERPVEGTSVFGLHFTSGYDKWVKPRF